MAGKEDIYVRYLHQLFRRCDVRGDGLLGKDEISELCDELQLTDSQYWWIVDRLIGDDVLIKVDFDDFKRVFVELLKQERCWDNEKESTCQENDNQDLMSKRVTKCWTDSRSGMGRRSESPSGESFGSKAIVHYLKTMWQSLNVGEDGFLDLNDLHSVCQGIGMSNTSDEVVNQLFESLDQDRDGRVSFDELLLGILRHLSQETSESGNESDSNPSIRKSVSSSDLRCNDSQETTIGNQMHQLISNMSTTSSSNSKSKQQELIAGPSVISSSPESSARSIITSECPGSSTSRTSSSFFPSNPSLLSTESSIMRRAFSADLLCSP